MRYLEQKTGSGYRNAPARIQSGCGDRHPAGVDTNDDQRLDNTMSVCPASDEQRTNATRKRS